MTSYSRTPAGTPRPATAKRSKEAIQGNDDSAPPSPFHWAAEIGEGLFGRFKQQKGEQTPSGSKQGGFSLKSLF